MAGGAMPPATGMPGSLQAPPGHPKPEDLGHPCQEQLPDLKYCINDNPPWRMLPLSCIPMLTFRLYDSKHPIRIQAVSELNINPQIDMFIEELLHVWPGWLKSP